MKNTVTVTTPTDRSVVVTRAFDAPRELVWEAMAKPELLKRWVFGPPGWEMTECVDDQRVGGSFRWAWAGPGGTGLTMDGVYREVSPPGRVVRTERFAGPEGAVMGEQLATVELTDRGGKTLMTVTLEYASKAARDGAVGSGMEHGMAASYDRLEGLLASAPA